MCKGIKKIEFTEFVASLIDPETYYGNLKSKFSEH